MKKRDLEAALRAAGWWKLRDRGKHEVWTNGSDSEPVPRHREIAEPLAQKIVRKAREAPGAGEGGGAK